MSAKVVVITGIGGMGVACARRIGSGAKLVLAEIDGSKLNAATQSLAYEGYDVTAVEMDVSDAAAVADLAKRASSLGTISSLVHTAGYSPNQASADRIYEVNLIGTALMMDAFEAIATPGMAAVFIASCARFSVSPPSELAFALARAPANDLLGLVTAEWRETPDLAYCLSKLGNPDRVQAAAVRWGKRGARINSISPGIISTPMGRFEQQNVPEMAVMLQISPIQRIGTAEDIAVSAEFLLSPQASFLTGTDLLVDGGVMAASIYGDTKPF